MCILCVRFMCLTFQLNASKLLLFVFVSDNCDETDSVFTLPS